MLAIGLMSGTSLDGVDAALVRFDDDQVTLVNFIMLPYDEAFRKRLFRNLNDDTAKLSEITSLHFALGYWFVDAIDKVLENTGYTYQDITFVASHGQTIWHDPKGNPKATLQIGEPSVISYKTGIKTIANFRAMDMIAGGEGAPLVPFSEFYQFKSKTQNIIMQNIGGIANFTYIKKNATLEDIISFDCGPGNIMIDYFTKKYFNIPYDDGGKIALEGKIIPEILNELKKDAFITAKPPKSTGREQYSETFMEKLATKMNFDAYEKQDIITTISEFTVYGICYQYQHFVKDIDVAVINGGGSHNQYIIKRLKALLTCQVLTGKEYGINSDAKEAVAFAVLGYMTLRNKPSNVKSATGAKDDVILGSITMNPKQSSWN